MSNSYFNFTTGRMVAGENALAEDVNAGFDAVAAGFDKLPTPDATKFLAGAHETTSGSAGNFVLAVTADSYFDGMAVSFKANHSNSGACTLNVGSLGAKSLVDGSGAALAVGDIVANSIYAARYNSTSDKFHLVGISSGNAADAAVVAANIADVATIADNIDELLLVDDNAIAAAASASDASGYADDALTQAGLAFGYADAASASAANLPNATTAGADKVVVSNTAGDGWEYLSITAAGKALIDDTSNSAQRTTLGLGNVDNTSDANKPVSSATQSALNLKANLASPALTGNPTAPTQAYELGAADSSTKLATTSFVNNRVAELTKLVIGSNLAQLLPSGLLIQVGTSYIGAVSGDASQVLFDSPYSWAPMVLVSGIAETTEPNHCWVVEIDPMSFKFRATIPGQGVTWIAIGYLSLGDDV